MKPHLVIFDCDGVLVDSEMIASRQLAKYLTKLGRPTDDAECRAAFIGISIKSVGELVRKEWGLDLPDDFIEHLRAHDREAFENELKGIPGVEEVLLTLVKERIDFCVASSGTPEKIRHSLDITGLLKMFDGQIFSASQVANGKPAPDLFEFAAFEMGTAPEDCLVIEDSPAGVQAAVAAKMRVLGFTGGEHCTKNSANQLIFSGAETTFSDMSDLPDLLKHA